MAGAQSLKENGIAEGSMVNLKELNVDDLRRLIAYQQREIARKNDRLRGVEKLTTICHDLEEKLQSSQTKSENYETALRRAEARIAYLNKKLGIGPQTSLEIDVIYPGVSRKDFDAVTKENIRLKEALEHIVPTDLGGKDILVMPIQEKETSFETIEDEERIGIQAEEMKKKSKTGRFDENLRSHKAAECGMGMFIDCHGLHFENCNFFT